MNQCQECLCVCVCVLHMFMSMRFFLDATESTCKQKKSLRIQFHSVSSMSSFPNLSSLHLVPALAFSFSAVSVSTGLLARCVCHVQRERLRGQEAPSSGILNFSHPNKRLVLSEKHCGYSVFCHEEATKQWPHDSSSGYAAQGKV